MMPKLKAQSSKLKGSFKNKAPMQWAFQSSLGGTTHMHTPSAITKAALVLLVAFAPLSSHASFAVFEKGTTNPAVLSIHSQCDGPGPGGEPVLELGIWPDGRIVWSVKTNGIRTYFAAKLHTNTVREAVQKFDRKGYFSDTNLSGLFFVPVDGCYDSVRVSDGTRSLDYQSYIDFAVATKDQIRELEQPPYNRGPQIQAWRFVVSELRASIPKSGDKLDSFSFRVRWAGK